MSSAVPELFQQLFREHYASIVRKIHHLIHDAAAAEDLAQEVFLRLYRTPPEDVERVGGWLHRVAVNAAYDYLRGASRRRALLEKQKLEHLQRFEPVPASDEIVIENWEKEVVRRVLRKLSDRDREALLMKQAGYSYAEIAEALKINPKTIGSVIRRAGLRFKKNAAGGEADSVE